MLISKQSVDALNLTERETEALLYCERDGNGKYVYAITGLVRRGLMSLQPIPKLQMVPAYRLNAYGLLVRKHCRTEEARHRIMLCYAFIESDETLTTADKEAAILRTVDSIIEDQLR